MKGLWFGKMAGHMKLQMLQAESLYATQQVAAELFPWEHEHQLALSAVVDPLAHADFYEERKLASVRCWTVQADRAPAEDIGGLAMLYGYRAQPDELWPAWFGLMPRLRGLGAGRELLDWVVDMARREGRRTLRLWTTDEAEYAAALRLYARCGFRTESHPALPGEEWRTLVLSLGLDGRLPVPWSQVAHRGELCGRELPVLHEAAA